MARVEMPNSRARSAMANRSRFSLSRRFTGLALLHGRVLIAQLLLAELADERLGKLILEDDLARHFQLVETLTDELLQFCFADGAPVLELDEGDAGLAAILVGHANDVGFVDRRVGQQRLLDGT